MDSSISFKLIFQAMFEKHLVMKNYKISKIHPKLTHWLLVIIFTIEWSTKNSHQNRPQFSSQMTLLIDGDLMPFIQDSFTKNLTMIDGVGANRVRFSSIKIFVPHKNFIGWTILNGNLRCFSMTKFKLCHGAVL